MKTLIKATLLLVIGLLILGGLILLYPLVPGTKSSPYPFFSNYDAARTESIVQFVEARKSIDALVIVDSASVQLSLGATHEPINTHSVRKGIINILFGMAVLNGQVDVDDTLMEIGLDDAEMPLTGAEKQARISDLLKARSGIYIESAGETSEMKNERPRRGQYAPDEHFYYNNWDFNTLGSILSLTTGKALVQHVQTLADRLEFEDFHPDHFYYQESNGSEHDQYTLFLSARDLARVGQMMLSGGQDAFGQPLITPAWIAESTTPYSTLDTLEPFEGYGYLWRMDAETGTWLASGWGGQYLLIDPDNDLVIVARNHTGRRLGALLWRVVLNRLIQGREQDMLSLRELVLTRRN